MAESNQGHRHIEACAAHFQRCTHLVSCAPAAKELARPAARSASAMSCGQLVDAS